MNDIIIVGGTVFQALHSVLYLRGRLYLNHHFHERR